MCGAFGTVDTRWWSAEGLGLQTAAAGGDGEEPRMFDGQKEERQHFIVEGYARRNTAPVVVGTCNTGTYFI